ncbi:Imm1 family immunity protein [Kitasatospora purpeofusca]|uniref:Imm1 family immunity protein n=1 Tax=Kitasatospora purpeofusca TaxID=67352 RepID=UPI0035D66E5F
MRAELRYRRGRMGDRPHHLNSLEDVDALIDELLAGPEDENLAQIIHLGRERVNPGWPDHELQVGVNKDLRVGVLSFADGSGNYETVGTPESRSSPEYHLGGHWVQFRDQVEISVELAREAVKEFLVSGGKRPACVLWKCQYLDDDQ